MPNTAIWFGRLLLLIGIAGYAYGLINPPASLTALIPAAFGAVLMLLGHLAASNEAMRKHLMHAAVLVGLLGFILPAGRLASKFSDLALSAGVLSQMAMAMVCLIFVVMCVRSFIAARRGDA